MKPRVPSWLSPTPFGRYILHWEASIERAVRAFSAQVPAGSRVLDAGAGEGHYARYFGTQRYVGIDLGVGDPGWNYKRLDAVADLAMLPFRNGSFSACINVVTLEHVRQPARALGEIARSLEPGGILLLVAPQEWEVHQAPHDYWRFTRYGVRQLLEEAGFGEIKIEPVGGLFRLLARRLLNGVQVVPLALVPLAAVLLGPPALLLPVFDFLDRERDFTLGYLCLARKSS